jgi:predicted nucleotide-binding protein
LKAGRGILSEGPDHQVVDMPRGAGPSWVDDDPTFRDHFHSWSAEVKSRPRVFLGYCSEAREVADAITMFLKRKLKIGVRNYAMDFVPGPTILEEVARSVRYCSCGIFLFTRSDEVTTADETRAAPRDNVIFEAGYFTHAKGKERTVIIREQGVKMPTDLGGNIYIPLESRKDISSIHTRLIQFLEEAL